MKTDSKIPGQVILGVIAIVLGVLFLLDNLRIIEDFRLSRLWPVIFIIFGVLKIRQSRTVPSYFVGSVLICVGTIMILHRLGIIYFSWHTWWPVFMILAGGAFILKGFYRHRGQDETNIPKADNEHVVQATAIFGGNSRIIASQDFKGGEVTAVMGGCEIDLRHASVADDATIHVFALFGGIDIKVPTDWAVFLNGTPILGGFDDKTLHPADQTKRLHIQGYAIMGGVEVRN